MSASCLYEGTIRHRRFTAEGETREFRHRLALAYLDLDEIPGLLGGRLVARGPGALRFRRRDYLGEVGTPLDHAVRERVACATGARPCGPIRLLTQLRSFGHCFNPVSFYYCFADEAATVLQAVVAEVTNTPWGERHAYVLPAAGGRVQTGFDKALHVSPFMAMDHRYQARATAPSETVSVHVESHRAGATLFDATLGLRRRELTRASAARMTARYPLATIRVLGLIYLHALGIKLAGFPIHRHPPAQAI